jgi:hypothetical protein
VVIGEAKPDVRGKELVRKVEYEKTPDGKETFKVTVSASGHRGQESSTPADQRSSELSLAKPVRPGGDQSDRCTLGSSEDDQAKSSEDWKLEA